MKVLVDKCILYIIGIFLLTIYGANEQTIMVCLLVIILGGSCFLIKQEVVKVVIHLIYFISCLFEISLFAFLPIFLYDCFLLNKKLMFLYIILFVYGMRRIDVYWMFFLMGAIFIAFILKKRYLQEEKLDQHYREQRDSSQELSLLLRKENKDLMLQKDYEVQLAILSERNRIAREIHDHVGHHLSSTLIQVGALQTLSKQENLVEPLNLIKATIVDCLDNIRKNVHALKDDTLDLEVVIHQLISSYKQYEIECVYDIVNLEDIQLKYAIIAIIKEALHNIYKHSNATKISIMLREQPVFYQLCIKDNGEINRDIKLGMGLSNMKDRIESYQGYINFKNENGFEIFITIPKNKGDLYENNHY